MRLEAIDINAFRGLRQLRRLAFENCNRFQLPDLSLVKANLNDFGLIGNPIKEFDAAYFDGFDVLSILFIPNNQISKCPDFRNVTDTLEMLDISSNPMRSLECLLGLTFNKLITLYLKHTGLTVQPIPLIIRTPSLAIFNVESNYITTLPDLRRVRDNQAKYPLYIIATGNMWFCKESLKWILDGNDQGEIMSFNEGSVVVRDEGRMYCYGPPHMLGMQYWNSSYKSEGSMNGLAHRMILWYE